MIKNVVSKQSLLRLPHYLTYLKNSNSNEEEYISATKIASELSLNHVVVRKDLASISSSGKPKIGYNKSELIDELESFLGYKDTNNAVIIGTGRLGQALLCYDGFKQCGLNIIAAFDIESERIKELLPDKTILPMMKIMEFCERTKVRIGIITVPDQNAQAIASLLVECGILAIWNFTSIRLNVPDNVMVQNENLVASMSLLSQHLSDEFQKKK